MYGWGERGGAETTGCEAVKKGCRVTIGAAIKLDIGVNLGARLTFGAAITFEAAVILGAAGRDCGSLGASVRLGAAESLATANRLVGRVWRTGLEGGAGAETRVPPRAVAVVSVTVFADALASNFRRRWRWSSRNVGESFFFLKSRKNPCRKSEALKALTWSS
jgi:hypothetical protein